MAVKLDNIQQQRCVSIIRTLLMPRSGLKIQLGVRGPGSTVSTHSGIWAGAPAAKEFLIYILSPVIVSGDNDFATILFIGRFSFSPIGPHPQNSNSKIFIMRSDRS